MTKEKSWNDSNVKMVWIKDDQWWPQSDIFLLVQVTGNWSTSLPSSSSVNVKQMKIPSLICLNLPNKVVWTKGEREREGGVHPGDLLPPPPLQRRQLPEVLEQELQGHQPPALLHHVWGEKQHSPRWTNTFFKQCGRFFFTGVLTWEEGGSLDLGRGLSRADSRMSRVVMVKFYLFGFSVRCH